MCVLLAAASIQAPVRVLGDFAPGWDAEWKREQLGGDATTYDVVDEGGDRVLHAVSNNAATALYRLIEPSDGLTSISWRWKVERSLAGNDAERSRSGDDYAARLFVIFGSGALGPSTRAVCYVWAAAVPIGSTYRSPYVDGVQTVVLRSGDGDAGVWVRENRDFAADYRRAFGEEPPRVGAIALMVDTDDTGSRAVAWYDDIVLR